MANGTTNQYSLLIKSFGFTVLQTTLLGTVTGAVSFVALSIAAIVLHHTKVSIARVEVICNLTNTPLERSRMDLAVCLHPHGIVQHFAARYETNHHASDFRLLI